ncbi:hypothetical protein [Nostoc sp. TCL26-01]|uniref:hypothetical protein n=1 Tax=Nostoc sp. TCL26-01 TaxID=2576904 RepID=UPI0015BDEA02|nr:hypothetical protein [Nostoc sp. TCL26-01]QLE55357.1 hypothetical protein FD725_07420 [Nostoc sp. TCL26-01]
MGENNMIFLEWSIPQSWALIDTQSEQFCLGVADKNRFFKNSAVEFIKSFSQRFTSDATLCLSGRFD